MFESKVGFVVSVSTRQSSVDPKQPGMVRSYQVVLITESLAKATKEAISQCPSDRTIIALTVQEIPVMLPIDPWKDSGEPEKQKEEKKDVAE